MGENGDELLRCDEAARPHIRPLVCMTRSGMVELDLHVSYV